MQLNIDGIKLPPKVKDPAPKTLEVPEYILKALRKNKQANAQFEAFSYSHKKEYVEWITGAKQEATREKRLTKAIELLSANKSLNWEYQSRKK
ncbi:MAG TPA: YdeI/OmpD-associated family protein, partial [Ferruginibacter sp.]|nr:YdeI/OmpD-associated family protein [Ferruginibacter sp.]